VKWLAGLALVAVACAGYTGGAKPITPRDLEQPGWVRAPDVPVVRQRALTDCGVAAAAMVLGRWQGVNEGTTFARAQVVPPSTLSAVDVRDLVRGEGLRAFVIEGSYDDLAHELGEGRPVIVGTVKPRTDGRAYRHYEVVVAVHADGRVATIDPSLGWRAYTRADFEAEWRAAHHTTIVVLPATDQQARVNR
jgi:predicted double-glycine peptidase